MFNQFLKIKKNYICESLRFLDQLLKMLKMSARGPQARPRAHPYILDSAFLHLCQDCCHDTFLHRAVTFKRIKLKIPAWSGFEGREKIFLTVMWFFLFKFFLVEISPLEAKTYNCLTFHNLYQEGCCC